MRENKHTSNSNYPEKQMTRKTVQGRPVFLKRLKSGWAVRWGRTVIVRCNTWQGALFEIMKLFEEFRDE